MKTRRARRNARLKRQARRLRRFVCNECGLPYRRLCRNRFSYGHPVCEDCGRQQWEDADGGGYRLERITFTPGRGLIPEARGGQAQLAVAGPRAGWVFVRGPAGSFEPLREAGPWERAAIQDAAETLRKHYQPPEERLP